MIPSMAWLALAILVGFNNAEVNNPVITLDLYRSMKSGHVGQYPVANANLASIEGAIKYLHTEVIVEHQLPIHRWNRKYEIDATVRWRYKVKNPKSMLTPNNRDNQYNEFGPFLTYDVGQSTNKDYDRVLKKYGDFVGIQMNSNHRASNFASDLQDPFFWFSVSGQCPNLPYIQQPHLGSNGVETNTMRCRSEHLCEAKGSPENPDPKCLHYDSDYQSLDLDAEESEEVLEQRRLSEAGFLSGGLCPDGIDNENFEPATDPTGAHGCVYSYGTPMILDTDDFVGIKNEECKGDDGVVRKCTDWLDFRQHCNTPEYQKKFAWPGRVIDARNVTRKPVCVEYDMHPQCIAGCHTAQCQAIPEEERELGLPFWKGRCNPQRNRERAERMAHMFEIAGALTEHTLVDSSLTERHTTCRPDLDNVYDKCLPLFNSAGGLGGPFCSRQWSGVCQTCYVPGTVSAFPGRSYTPTCPRDILSYPDYANLQDRWPTCQSKNAADGCCQYTGDCVGETDPLKATLDNEGFHLVSIRESTDDMAIFLGRVAARNKLGSLNAGHEGLRNIAHHSWRKGFINHTLVSTVEKMQSLVKPKQQKSAMSLQELLV